MSEKRAYTEADVIERFGRGLPKYRKATKERGYVRSFDKTDRAEMKAVTDWLVEDQEFIQVVDVYACYCRILALRGYGSSEDRRLVLEDHSGLVGRLCLNFAKCETEHIWHDMLGSANAIMTGDGSADGYWPFLDREYLDISHMKVGKAIINLDEVWAVVDSTMDEFVQKCAEREAGFLKNSSFVCDRCKTRLYSGRLSRFDPYENILHCEKCAKEFAHWKGLKK